MRFWRICRRPYIATDGEGAFRYGGRWNSPGVRVVYASSSLALAAVETFVHLEPNLMPADLVVIAGAIPDGLAIGGVEAATLPEGWRTRCAGSLRRWGDEWIGGGESLALLVPSAVIRGEWNLLLNPAHADYARIEYERIEPFAFDTRMWRGAS